MVEDFAVYEDAECTKEMKDPEFEKALDYYLHVQNTAI